LLPELAAGAGRLGGYWFGKTDASVYLEEQVTAAQREAIRKRISALDVVAELSYESKADAYARFNELESMLVAKPWPPATRRSSCLLVPPACSGRPFRAGWRGSTASPR
jgi:hypothetical protein